MAKTWKIVRGVLVGLLLTVYVAVALANYSVVQSYLGTAAGRYFSREWGGTLKIGALHAMPWDHLIVNNVLLVAPDGDTLLDVERLSLRFRKFPYSDMHLTLDRVAMRNGYYHLRIDKSDEDSTVTCNFQYIIDYYSDREWLRKDGVVFTVDVGVAVLDHVRYKMDLPEVPGMDYEEGVHIAHMDFTDIVTRVRDIHVENDNVRCRLVKFRCEERSGFAVDQAEGHVHVGPQGILVTDFEIHTPQTTVLADVSLVYDGWEKMADYVNSVHHDVVLKEGSVIALSDAAYWAPMLWGTDVVVEGSASMQGTINAMGVGADLRWGSESALMINGTVHNITTIDTATLDIDIERLHTTVDDMSPLLARLHTDAQTTLLLEHLGFADVRGRVRGGMKSHSTANLDMNCNLGDMRTDVLLMPLGGDGIHFDAEVESHGLTLNLLQSEWLTQAGCDISVSGDCYDMHDPGSLQAMVEGHVLNSVVRGQRLAPIDITAKLEEGSGRIQVWSHDTLASMDIDADFDLADSVKRVECIVDVRNLDLLALNLLPEKYGQLQTNIVLQLQGQSLDTMEGNLEMQHTLLGYLQLEEMNLSVKAGEGRKVITLRSDPVDISADGRFSYAALPLIARQLGSEVLPHDLVNIDTLDADETAMLKESNINLDIRWKDSGSFLHTIDQDLTVARNTRLTANYNASERLKLTLRSQGIRYGSIRLADIGLNGNMSEGDFVTEIRVEEVDLGDLELLQHTTLQLTSNSRRTLAGLAWGIDQSSTNGDLLLQLKDRRIEVLKPGFTIGLTPWQLQIASLTVDTAGGISLVGEGIGVQSDDQSITASASLQHQSNDYVEMMFNNFGLSGIADILLRDSPITVSGAIGGRVSVFGFTETPYFNANLAVAGCTVNRHPLGDIQLQSHWNAAKNTLRLFVSSDQLYADGTVELGGEDTPIDFEVDFDRFELGLAAPLLSEISSRFEGRLHGNFNIEGTLERPVIEGDALVEDGVLQIDMTGVTYTFSDSIRFTDKKVTLDNFRIHDPLGNTAYIGGSINYDNLDDTELDMIVRTEKLLVLNKKNGEDFYGTLLTSAGCALTGNLDNLYISVNAQTKPGCTLTVPVNDQRQAKSQDYITFVSDQPLARDAESTARKDRKLTLDVNLSITPDAEIFLPMDFSEVKVTVDAKGTGDLNLTLEGANAPQVTGTYEIQTGTMKTTLLSVREWSFDIDNGSSLNFPGDLTAASFDLRAIHLQNNVNLSSLTGSLSDLDGTQKSIKVENIITVSGTLQDPALGFDLRLRDVDPSVEDEVFTYIDRNSERDMMNQTLSLLLTGHFYNSNSTATQTGGNLATTSGISVLSNVLTGMVEGVDINVDYRLGTELTTDQFDVNISKDWGRWYLESTLGYGGESRELQNGNGNTAVIDALLGYRISPLVHLFAYNRTNTNDYTRLDLPYKQGVGMKLTKDFNEWGELFRKKKQ